MHVPSLYFSAKKFLLLPQQESYICLTRCLPSRLAYLVMLTTLSPCSASNTSRTQARILRLVSWTALKPFELLSPAAPYCCMDALITVDPPDQPPIAATWDLLASTESDSAFSVRRKKWAMSVLLPVAERILLLIFLDVLLSVVARQCFIASGKYCRKYSLPKTIGTTRRRCSTLTLTSWLLPIATCGISAPKSAVTSSEFSRVISLTIAPLWSINTMAALTSGVFVSAKQVVTRLTSSASLSTVFGFGGSAFIRLLVGVIS